MVQRSITPKFMFDRKWTMRWQRGLRHQEGLCLGKNPTFIGKISGAQPWAPSPVG